MASRRNRNSSSITFWWWNSPARFIYSKSEEWTGAAFAPIGAWVTGGSLNTARRGLGGAGTRSSCIRFWWRLLQVTAANTEIYNGQIGLKLNDMNDS